MKKPKEKMMICRTNSNNKFHAMNYNKSPPEYFREQATSLKPVIHNPNLYQWHYL